MSLANLIQKKEGREDRVGKGEDRRGGRGMEEEERWQRWGELAKISNIGDEKSDISTQR